MPLELSDLFPSAAGYIVDNNCAVADGALSAVSGGSRVAIVLPEALAGADNPVEAIIASLLGNYRAAAEAETPAQDTIRAKPRVENEDIELVYTVRTKAALGDITGDFAENQDAFDA